MPYSWNRPPVPIDKSKQGGRNFDSSKYTDFLKIGTIAAVNSTKEGENNKNLYTNDEEKRRADILISGLQTIPRAFCSLCVNNGSLNNDTLDSQIVSNLSGITFFIVNFTTSGDVYYNNNRLYTNAGLTTIMRNTDIETSPLSVFRVGLDSLATLPSNATRGTVASTLDAVLYGDITLSLPGYPFRIPGESTDSRLRVSINPEGKLVLTIEGPWYTTTTNPPRMAGIFFGDGPLGTGNGSTSLGATNSNGVCGVDGAALLITDVSRSVTAPFQIAASGIDFSLPPGGC